MREAALLPLDAADVVGDNERRVLRHDVRIRIVLVCPGLKPPVGRQLERLRGGHELRGRRLSCRGLGIAIAGVLRRVGQPPQEVAQHPHELTGEHGRVGLAQSECREPAPRA